MDGLKNAHGKVWVKLSDIACEIMRVDNKIERNQSRGGDPTELKIVRERMANQYETTQNDLDTILKVMNIELNKETERLGGDRPEGHTDFSEMPKDKIWQLGFDL